MFAEFASVAGLGVEPGSISSTEPPEPDISFVCHGKQHFAELVEITDQRLARRVSISLKEMRITGGSFSQRKPVFEAFQRKSQKMYRTGGAPLVLLAYYDKQFPADSVESGLIPQEVGEIAATMVDSGVWQRTWVYDRWEKRVLWVYPPPEKLRLRTITLLALLVLCAVTGLVILGVAYHSAGAR